MIVVTGGAGFIGSALVAELNRRGRRDILIVDEVDHPEKEHNLKPLHYERVESIANFRTKLNTGQYNDSGIEVIFHLGACSATTETNWEYLADNNVAYTKEILAWGRGHGVKVIYASSAATYGDGSHGYSDTHELFDSLVPLNLYGKSKLDVDIWARDNGYLDLAVGLRYFNVFGPNEFHKEGMRSVIAKKHPEVLAGKGIELFRSYNPDFGDGEQKRDFVYVKDAVSMTLFFFDTPVLGGIFNIGTGTAETWNSVAKALFAATEQTEDIRYVDMPEALRNQYQYFTEADMNKLKEAGWTGTTTPLAEAIQDYVRVYLTPHLHLGEESDT